MSQFWRISEDCGPATIATVAGVVAACLVPADHALARADQFATALLTVASILAGFQTVVMSLIGGMERTLGLLSRTNHLDRFFRFVLLGALSGYCAVAISFLSIAMRPDEPVGNGGWDADGSVVKLLVGVNVGVAIWALLQNIVMLNIWRNSLVNEIRAEMTARENKRRARVAMKAVASLPVSTELEEAKKPV